MQAPRIASTLILGATLLWPVETRAGAACSDACNPGPDTCGAVGLGCGPNNQCAICVDNSYCQPGGQCVADAMGQRRCIGLPCSPSFSDAAVEEDATLATDAAAPRDTGVVPSNDANQLASDASSDDGSSSGADARDFPVGVIPPGSFSRSREDSGCTCRSAGDLPAPSSTGAHAETAARPIAALLGLAAIVRRRSSRRRS